MIIKIKRGFSIDEESRVSWFSAKNEKSAATGLAKRTMWDRSIDLPTGVDLGSALITGEDKGGAKGDGAGGPLPGSKFSSSKQSGAPQGLLDGLSDIAPCIVRPAPGRRAARDLSNRRRRRLNSDTRLGDAPET